MEADKLDSKNPKEFVFEDITPLERKLVLHVRFYIALILHSCIQNEKDSDIVKYFDVSHRFVETVKQKAGQYMANMITFCDRLRYWHLSAIFEAIRERVDFAVNEEIAPYVRIGISLPRAKRLKQGNWSIGEL